MEFLSDYGLFLAKTLTALVAFLVIFSALVNASQKIRRAAKKGHIEVERLNEYYEDLKETLLAANQSPQQYKSHLKLKKELEKKKGKEEKKKVKNEGEGAFEHRRKTVYVVDFYGDIKASEVVGLKQIISSIVSVAREQDEVVVCIESGGGMVHSYGLASSELSRITRRKIPLTICIDKVAASGGYMMACTANKILAAPFALVGSIGVLAQLPNFNRLLKKHDIDYEQITAGEYKRTLTIFGENTEQGRNKFKEEIEDTHELFKQFVKGHRPALDIDQVATGEAWFGSRAIEKGLIDEIKTSEDYLLELSADCDLLKITYVEKHSLQEKLGLGARHVFDSLYDVMLQKDRENRLSR